MSLSIPIQAPCRQLYRSQPRRLKETLPLIGTAASANEHDEEEHMKLSHGTQPADNAEMDYTPPSNLQQQVHHLEQVFQHENWIMLNELSKVDRKNDAGFSLALAASMIVDMDSDDEDDYDSIESIRSLREELKWAEIELCPSPTREINTGLEPSTSLRLVESSDESSNLIHYEAGNDTKDHTISECGVSPSEERITKEFVQKGNFTTNRKDSDSSCLHEAEELRGSSSDLKTKKLQDESYESPSFFKKIRRTNSILLVSSALFVASLLVGDQRKKIKFYNE